MHICMFKVAYGAAGISCMSVSSRYNTQKYFCMHAAVREAPRDFISVSSLTNAIGGEREGKELEKKKHTFLTIFHPEAGTDPSKKS